MKKILTALVLLTSTQATYAVQWSSVSANEKANYFIDKDSIRKTNDGFVEFWVKINFLTPKVSEDKSTKYLSEKDLMLIDCNRRVYKQPYAVAYSMPDGGGIVVADYKNAKSEEIPIIPESISDFYRRFVCGQK